MKVNTQHQINELAPTATVAGDAVGVPGLNWYVAYMRRHNTEKAAAANIASQGLETYVASQKEYRHWRNGRRALVDRVVIPGLIFIRCTEQQRRQIVYDPAISRFMTDRAGQAPAGLNKPVAVIPPREIEMLRFMLGQSDVPVDITTRQYSAGDKVTVIRGGLKGLEGEIINVNDGKGELIVALDYFGNARLSIETINVKPLE